MFDGQTKGVQSVQTLETTAEFPDKLQCLFVPKRYKVLWGGRGAGRSWGVARALLLEGTNRAIRVLCVRELQNSISESVHKLLSDQIDALGLGFFYEVQVAKIIGKNGTSFAFEGIKNNTTKIKSYEGIDYCWVEEANKVSRTSWGVLIPTIRKEGSEIWITFNPELETDYTYQRFAKDEELKACPPGRFGQPINDNGNPVYESPMAFSVKMTWEDNRWFPQVLRDEKDDLRKRDEDAYLNVWEGHTVQTLQGAVYANELRKATQENRICSVPWDRETPVDTFWDLGRADSTAIWFAQKVAMQYRILEYFEDSGPDIHHYLQHCQNRPYTYGTFYLPHDAKAIRLGTKRTIEEIIRASGRTVRIVPKLSKVDGINAARIIFPNCWFDEKKCADGINSLRHYHFRVKDGQLSNEPVHDWASDGADAFRYLAVAIRGPRAKSTVGEKLRRAVNAFQEEAPGQGWMN